MKTRIFYTKFWTDPYILTLTSSERLLFNFLITNENIGVTSIYEIATGIIQLTTGLTILQIETAKKRFMDDKKIFFYKDWILVKNIERYQVYSGEKNEIARKKELDLIPDKIKEILYGYCMDRVSGTPDTPPIVLEIRNNKSEIIKGVVRGKKYSSLEDVEESDFVEISQTYKVSLGFVKLQWEKLKNWCEAKGKKYKDYKHALRNWVLMDMQRQVERRQQDGSKQGIDARHVI